MKSPEFNSVPREDELLEEMIVEQGKEDYPLRRAVGMPAFESEEERETYIAERKLALEKDELKLKIKKAIETAFLKNMGKPSVKEDIAKAIGSLDLQLESVNIEVDEDFYGYSVQAKSAKYGDLDFRIR